MTSAAQTLADQLGEFNDQLMAFVKEIPESGWKRRCQGEAWTVGVVARHIGVGHYGIIQLAERMVSGKPLPSLSHEKINEMGNTHAAKHADCTKEEVLSILAKKGRALVAYAAGLDDADLECRADMPTFGGTISVRQLLEGTILRSGGEHMESMRRALANA